MLDLPVVRWNVLVCKEEEERKQESVLNSADPTYEGALSVRQIQ
jgi:hypothetical protein